MLIARVVFGASITIFGVAVVNAMRVESAPQIEVLAIAPTEATMQVATPAVQPSDSPEDEAWVAETTSPRLPSVALERAVSQDPFQPDRRAPAQRYVLPDQRVVVANEEREPTEAPSFRVVGTARIGQGGLVLVQVDDGDAPVVVSVSESIEGYRLVSVTDEGATLAADGSTFALSVVEPREERRRSNNRGNTNWDVALRGQDQELIYDFADFARGDLSFPFSLPNIPLAGRGGGGQ